VVSDLGHRGVDAIIEQLVPAPGAGERLDERAVRLEFR